MRLSKADSTPPCRLQLKKSGVRSLGHLRITAHIQRKLDWSVRDSWVNWDRLESVALSRQSFSDLKFSEIVDRSCTFSCQFHRAVQVVIELQHWAEFGSADRPDRGRLIPFTAPPPPQLALTVSQLVRLPSTVWADWISLRPTELSWVQLFATKLDQYYTSLFESSWVWADRSM